MTAELDAMIELSARASDSLADLNLKIEAQLRRTEWICPRCEASNIVEETGLYIRRYYVEPHGCSGGDYYETSNDPVVQCNACGGYAEGEGGRIILNRYVSVGDYYNTRLLKWVRKIDSGNDPSGRYVYIEQGKGEPYNTSQDGRIFSRLVNRIKPISLNNSQD